MIPSIIPIVLAVKLIWKRETSSLLGLGFVAIVMIVCEAILKHTIRQARPLQSCDCSFGMPSSHSALSYGFLIWVYLEVGFPLYGFEALSSARSGLSPHYRRVTYLVAATICLVPVPFSRVYFFYHTVSQVLIGVLVGAILALGWFGILRGLIVPKGWLDKLVLLRPLRAIKAVNDYRARPPTSTPGYSGSTTTEMDVWPPRGPEP